MGTLRYAYRARNIENCAVVNVDSKCKRFEDYVGEICS